MDVDTYLRLREKEGRRYTDEVVAQLPRLERDHILEREWRIRGASAARLVRYLSRPSGPRAILDLGCGNGWLSNVLFHAGHRVAGMDRNRPELEQAARVFRPTDHLIFLDADISDAPFAAQTFDVILLASAIQYFPDLPNLISLLRRYLRPQGEIHIIDSPLYLDHEVDDATRRSREYYSAMGFPEMHEHYFHHRLSDVLAYHPVMLHNPRSISSRLRRSAGWPESPFPWLIIRGQG